MSIVAARLEQLTRFPRRFLSAARHRGPVTAHFDGKRFRNTTPTMRWSTEVFKWLLSRRPEAWPDAVESVAAPLPMTRSDGLRVTLVNHATVLIQVCGLNILTDPVWSDRVGPYRMLSCRRVRAPGIAFDDLPPIDLILLSHDHYDHLDVPTLKRLMTRDQPRLLTGLGVDTSLSIEGLDGAEALDWWESRHINTDVRVTFAPCRHFSGRGLNDQDATLWGSFVLHTPHGAVYFGGDTGYGPHFEEVRKLLGPMTLALLPIGCYEPRWFMGPVHMAPEEAVRAHQDLGATRSLGIHFGTFRLGDEGYERPGADLKAAVASAGLPPEAFTAPAFGVGDDIVAPPMSIRQAT